MFRHLFEGMSISRIVRDEILKYVSSFPPSHKPTLEQDDCMRRRLCRQTNAEQEMEVHDLLGESVGSRQPGRNHRADGNPGEGGGCVGGDDCVWRGLSDGKELGIGGVV